MAQGYLHSIESMGLFDGPGIRTIFFLQGCPLRCVFCHNPDSQAFEQDKPISPEEVLRQANRYKPYYGKEGGVTFSGGEPLAQVDFLEEALTLLKSEGFHTTVDTSGVANPREVARLLDKIDLFLLDVKAFNDEKFREIAGSSKKPLDLFMHMLQEEHYPGKIWIRHVMLPGVSDTEASMDDLLATIEPLRSWIERIEILPYHLMGVDKYKDLGRSYPLEGMPAMDQDKAKALENYANHKFFSDEKKKQLATA